MNIKPISNVLPITVGLSSVDLLEHIELVGVVVLVVGVAPLVTPGHNLGGGRCCQATVVGRTSDSAWAGSRLRGSSNPGVTTIEFRSPGGSRPTSLGRLTRAGPGEWGG